MAAARLLPLLRRRLAATIADSPSPSSRGTRIYTPRTPYLSLRLSIAVFMFIFLAVLCFNSG